MSKKTIFAKNQIDNIQKLLNEGVSKNKIRKLYDVSYGVISRIINENNLHRIISNTEIMRKRLPGYKELEEEICEYYQNNKIGMAELGEKYGLGICCIENILKRNNVERLKPWDFVKLYDIDENYFEKIDNDNKAYILGLLYADGSIGSNNYKIEISLQEEDVEILEKIRKEFKLQRQLLFRKPPDKYPNRKPQYSLRIENKTFYENLLLHGLTPRKSYDAKFPQIDTKYYRSFIRGVFDGDGCLYHNVRQNTNTITFTGTFELIDKIGDIIQNEIGIIKRIHVAQNSKEIDKNTRVLMFGGNNQVKRFLDWLYQDAELYLQRKYDKYCLLYNINDSLSA